MTVRQLYRNFSTDKDQFFFFKLYGLHIQIKYVILYLK